MSTQYKYSILVTFVHPNPNLAGQQESVSYGPNIAKVDNFLFNQRSVRIYAIRTRKIGDTYDELYGKANAISNQIQKAIEYYYITCPILTRVSSIRITCKTKTTTTVYGSASSYKQPLPYKRGINNPWLLTPTVARDMLQYGGNGLTYRIVLSYCLRTCIEKNEFTVFSLLWRAFNALFRQGSHSTKDSEGLNFIERMIRTNQHVLTHSNAMISQYRRDFSSLRWEKFILNKVSFDTHQCRTRTLTNGTRINLNGTKTRDFFTHYFDGGINNHFEQILNQNSSIVGKINSLRGTNLSSINSHLNRNGIVNGFRDIDVLVILVKEYAYFLRNTLFHGVVDEPSFTLGKTQEQKELELAKVWLENIIKDLLNNHLI